MRAFSLALFSQFTFALGVARADTVPSAKLNGHGSGAAGGTLYLTVAADIEMQGKIDVSSDTTGGLVSVFAANNLLGDTTDTSLSGRVAASDGGAVGGR